MFWRDVWHDTRARSRSQIRAGALRGRGGTLSIAYVTASAPAATKYPPGTTSANVLARQSVLQTSVYRSASDHATPE